MSLPTEALVICPHCGEQVPVDIDPSGGRQQRYVEDCWVCCRPILLTVEVLPTGDVTINAVQAE